MRFIFQKLTGGSQDVIGKVMLVDRKNNIAWQLHKPHHRKGLHLQKMKKSRKNSLHLAQNLNEMNLLSEKELGEEVAQIENTHGLEDSTKVGDILFADEYH